MKKNIKKNNKILVFDLGGVFIKLTGVPTMQQWTGNTYTDQQLWERWFNSAHVKQFETGRIDPETFACGLIHEFNLPVDPGCFLDHFASWSNELYSGARRLMAKINTTHTTACLSNTNIIHWSNLCRKAFDQYFDYTFVSHEIGYLKPDADIYQYTLTELGCSSEQVVFFDDTPINIAAARSLGMEAYLVAGIDQLKDSVATVLKWQV